MPRRANTKPSAPVPNTKAAYIATRLAMPVMIAPASRNVKNIAIATSANEIISRKSSA